MCATLTKPNIILTGRSDEYSRRLFILPTRTGIGTAKDYSGKITWLNRLAGKYPASPYAISALYEKGRSYVLMDNNQQAITSFKELLAKYPEAQSAARQQRKSVCSTTRMKIITRPLTLINR